MLKKTHRLLAEGHSLQKETNNKLDEVLGEFSGLRNDLEKIRKEQHRDLEDIKRINFATWRDGVGQNYWNNYRPVALAHLSAYDQMSQAWRILVQDRVLQVAADFNQWKDPSWKHDALKTGIYFDPPEPPQYIPPNELFTNDLPEKNHQEDDYFKKSITSFFSILAGGFVVSAFISMVIPVNLLFLVFILACIVSIRIYKKGKFAETHAETNKIKKEEEYYEKQRNESVKQRNKINSELLQWKNRNKEAHSEMTQRFKERVEVPFTAKGYEEFWASNRCQQEAHTWLNIISSEEIQPPDVSTLTLPQRLEINSQIPNSYLASIKRQQQSINN